MELIDHKSPILNQCADNFDFENPQFDIEGITKQMFDIMEANSGIGLAGPQVGIPYKIFVMKHNFEKFVCVNPDFDILTDEKINDKEGCLSFPKLQLSIKRHDQILARYQNESGVKKVTLIDGLLSRCFQHEYDHVFGVTFDKHVSKLKLDMAVKKQKKALKGDR